MRGLAGLAACLGGIAMTPALPPSPRPAAAGSVLWRKDFGGGETFTGMQVGEGGGEREGRQAGRQRGRAAVR